MSYDQSEIIYAISDQLTAMVESGSKTLPLMPWHSRGAYPVNMHSNEPYSGANVIRLWGHAERRLYTHDRWATFKQIGDLDGRIKKGEGGTFILKFMPEERDAAGNVVRGAYFKRWLVWNIEQTTLPQTPRVGSRTADDRLADAAYLSIKDNLKASGNEAYDALVCDIGAAFLLARDGYKSKPRPDHAKYARGWLAIMKVESTDAAHLTLWTASAQAARIVEKVTETKMKAA